MKSRPAKQNDPRAESVKTLTKAEEQVMLTLWKLEKGFLKDILDATAEPKPHSNTVATLLKILIEKGYVGYEPVGRNNLYKPLVAKLEYGKKGISQLVSGYFDGSAARLVSQFVDDNKLTLKELEDLLEQIRFSKKNKI